MIPARPTSRRRAAIGRQVQASVYGVAGPELVEFIPGCDPAAGQRAAVVIEHDRGLQRLHITARIARPAAGEAAQRRPAAPNAPRVRFRAKLERQLGAMVAVRRPRDRGVPDPAVEPLCYTTLEI